MLIVMICGCSDASVVNTELTFNEDMSGSRVMYVVVDQDVVADEFDGTMEDINTVINATAPASLSITYDEETVSYEVVLSFESIEDYELQVESITGEDESIVILEAENPLTTGMKVTESFSTTDLLSWMPTALYDAGLITSSQTSYVFEIGTSTVIVGENSYSGSDTIDVDTMEYVSIESFTFYTDIISLDEYVRTVEVEITNAALSLNEEEIIQHFEDLVPDGASGQWVEGTSSKTFVLEIESTTLEDLASITAAFLDNEAAYIELTEDSSSVFVDANTLKEGLAFGMFSDTSGSTDLYYWVHYDEEYEFSNYTGSNVAYCEQNDDGYYLILDSYINDEVELVNYSLEHVYYVAKMDVHLDNSMFSSDITRTTTIYLDGIPEDEKIDSIVASLEAGVYPEYDDEGNLVEQDVTGYDIDTKEKDDQLQIIITQTGTQEEIIASSNYLFGEGDSFVYSDEGGLFSLTKEFVFSDYFYYYEIVDYRNDDFVLTYTADLGLFASQEELEDYDSDLSSLYSLLLGTSSNAVIEGSNFTEEFSGLSGTASYTGTYTNIFAVIIYLAIVGVIAGGLFIAKKKGMLGSKKPTAIEEQEVTQEVQEGVQEVQEVQDGVQETVQEEVLDTMYCEECGQEIDSDSVYCCACGAEVE